MDAAVGTHGKCRADRFLILARADGNGDNLVCPASFPQAKGFFNGNFVERIHCHLHIGKFHTGIIGFHTYLDVIVDDAFDRD